MNNVCELHAASGNFLLVGNYTAPWLIEHTIKNSDLLVRAAPAE